MPEEDCPTCNDHPPQGEPVRGNEDVFAYAAPMPADDQLTSWSTTRAMAQSATQHGARVELLEGIPQPLRDMAGPIPGMTSTQLRPMAKFTSPQRIVHDRVVEANGEQAEYLPPLGAPWREQAHGASATASFDKYILFEEGDVADAAPEPKYPNGEFPDWIKKEIKENWPKVDEDDLRGDEDGAALIVHVESVKDSKHDRYKKKKRAGEEVEPVDRTYCGGKVRWVIPIVESVPRDTTPREKRRILDWAYGLKRAEATRMLGGCKSDLCEENASTTVCEMFKSAMVGLFQQVDAAGEVITSISYVEVQFQCKCAEPPEEPEGPITGPGAEDDDGNDE